MGQRRFVGRVAAVAMVLSGLGGTVALADQHPPVGGSGYGYGYGVTCKPGWGHGDRNHCHSGPPGLVHRPTHPSHPVTPSRSGHPGHGEDGNPGHGGGNPGRGGH